MAQKSQAKVAPESRNLPGEIFAFIAGIIGFIVDTVGLVGIISGFVSLPAGSFLKSNPLALAVVTLSSIVYSLVLLLYFIRRKVRARWRMQSVFLSKDADGRWIHMAAHLLWIPIFFLWSIAIWSSGADAGYQAPGIAIVFIIFCYFGLFMGGHLLCEIVRYFDMALNPLEEFTLEEARRSSLAPRAR